MLLQIFSALLGITLIEHIEYRIDLTLDDLEIVVFGVPGQITIKGMETLKGLTPRAFYLRQQIKAKANDAILNLLLRRIELIHILWRSRRQFINAVAEVL